MIGQSLFRTQSISPSGHCWCNHPGSFSVNMMTSSNGNISALLALCVGNSPVPGEFPAQRPVTRALLLSLVCARINGWVNNGETGDLRHHRAHYDVIVMKWFWWIWLRPYEPIRLTRKQQSAMRMQNAWDGLYVSFEAKHIVGGVDSRLWEYISPSW